jgi:hypothetical protein
MFVAGWIIFSISLFFIIVMVASGGDDAYVAALIFVVYFLIPGIVFICVGKGIRNRRQRRNLEHINKPNQSLPAEFDYYICPDCEYQVFEDYKCCPRCGVKLDFKTNNEKFCTACGNEMKPDHAFCSRCGKKR